MDETGHTFRTRFVRTWAPVGEVPVLRRSSGRREISSLVAITPDGRLYARHVPGSVNGAVVIMAIKYFRRQIGTPLLLIMDRLSAHRSREVRAFLAAHRADVVIEWLPSYAPELQPEELCNGLVKHATANALPDSIDDLHGIVRREFRRLQYRPEVIRQCFVHVGLIHAA
jgi:transposase